MSNMIAAKALLVEMRTRYNLQLDNTVVFRLLEYWVSARLHELETILRAARVPSYDSDSDQVQVCERATCSDKTEAMVELKRTRILPFCAEKTSNIAWETIKLGGFPNERTARVIGCSDDMLTSEGGTSHPLGCGGSIDLRVHCLMKRVPIPEGFAVLIESIPEWFAYPASSSPWSYVTRDSGWALVYPLEENCPTSACRVQTMVRVATADTEEAGFRHQQRVHSQLTSAVGDVVIPLFREIMSSKYQLLDNALLDSSRAPVA